METVPKAQDKFPALNVISGPVFFIILLVGYTFVRGHALYDYTPVDNFVLYSEFFLMQFAVVLLCLYYGLWLLAILKRKDVSSFSIFVLAIVSLQGLGSWLQHLIMSFRLSFNSPLRNFTSLQFVLVVVNLVMLAWVLISKKKSRDRQKNEAAGQSEESSTL